MTKQYPIGVGTFDRVDVSGEPGNLEFRFMTEEHGDIHLHEEQVVALILRVGEMLVDVGSLKSDAGFERSEPGSFYGSSVRLMSVPSDRRIYVLKAMRSAIPGLGLKEGMGMINSTPTVLKDGVSYEEAADLKDLIEIAGGVVELQED